MYVSFVKHGEVTSIDVPQEIWDLGHLAVMEYVKAFDKRVACEYSGLRSVESYMEDQSR